MNGTEYKDVESIRKSRENTLVTYNLAHVQRQFSVQVLIAPRCFSELAPLGRDFRAAVESHRLRVSRSALRVGPALVRVDQQVRGAGGADDRRGLPVY